MKKSKKGFMFEMLGMLLAVMLWCVPMEVSAEGEYKLPFHTTYDITEKVFNIELTLETEEDVYLAYYSGSIQGRGAAFENAIFTGEKSAVVSVGGNEPGSFNMFWVVDAQNNLIADVYPEWGNEVFTDAYDLKRNYVIFTWLDDGIKYYLDKEFSDAVEFVNGEDFGEHDFNAKIENGIVTAVMPENKSTQNDYFYVYRDGKRVEYGFGGIWSFDAEKNIYYRDIHSLIDESGEYTIVFWLEDEGVRSKNQFITFTYEKPEQQVSAPASVKWDTGIYGKCLYEFPEQMAGIDKFIIQLENKKGDSDFEWGTRYIIRTDSDYRFTYFVEPMDYLTQNYEDVVFRVAMRAISSDIENYAHSDWVYSDVYDPSAVKTPEEQVRAFVERMYTVALGRESDPSGIDYWANQLLTHQADGASLSEGFILSDEFEEKNYSNAEYLEVLYTTFFNREADEGGIAHWTSQMESGKSRRSVLAGFVNSNEFDELCTSYGIDRGTMSEGEPSGEVPAEGGVEQFVERLYTVCLERASEPAGLAEWTRRINAGESTPEEVAKFFFMSDEYVEKNTSNEKYIETLYLTFMDRTAEAGGKAYWVEQLNQGVSREVALSGFAQSPEFQEIMDRYGL